jgi:Tfp pilus assembly protein PilF
MTLNHDLADTLFAEGTSLIRDGRFAEAEALLREADRLLPNSAEIHANLGLLLDQSGRWSEAEVCYKRSLAITPTLAQTHLNYGALLLAQKRFSEAEGTFRQAVSIDPASPGAWSSLGVLLACLKQEKEAEVCYRTALQLDPTHRNASFNLAYILLRQGRFEEGWHRLEARKYCALEEHLGCPRWQGESLTGKAILVGFEAGQGDMIHFCRYVSMLKERGAARVDILCHPGLKPLFKGLAGIDQAIALDEPWPEASWHYWVLPFSLPSLFQTRLETIPGRLPYLHVNEAKVANWKALMGDTGNALRIGLVWKGNPRFENDLDRSMASLDTLAPLGKLGGVRYFSLQKGNGENEAARLSQSFPLTDLAPSIDDFADTAAAIMNLDLIISVDTAVAHLAGALARPCWLLLPAYTTDWRWLMDRDDTPWYPGVMKLFRQKGPGDWSDVVTDLKASLQELLASRQATTADTKS